MTDGSWEILDGSTPDAQFHDHGAELAVLGCLSLGDEFVSRAAALLTEDHFYDLLNREIFKAFVSNNSCDQIRLVDTLRKELGEHFNAGHVVQRIDDGARNVPSGENLTYYAEILREMERKRSLKDATAKAVNSLDEGGDYADAAAIIDSHLADTKVEREGSRTTKEVVLSAIEQIENWQTHDGVVVGVPTGFSQLDMLTGGLQPGDMFVLAARPSVGKTAVGLNIAATAALEHKKGVMFFSLEMSSESLVIRMLSSVSEVSSHRMRQKQHLTKSEMVSISNASSKINSAPIKFFDQPGMNLYEIKAAARGWCKNNDVELMVVDYLQLVNAPSGKYTSRQQQVAEISAGLKALARELNVSLLVLAQLNRDSERDARNPRMADLRESGSIEQDADCVALLHRPDKEDDVVKLILDKQRNGPTGMVPLLFRRSINKFEQGDLLPE